VTAAAPPAPPARVQVVAREFSFVPSRQVHPGRRDVSAADAGAVVIAAAPPSPPARVQVVAREFSFVLSRQVVRAGAAIIELRNAGEDAHDLRLRRVGGTHVWAWPVTAAGGVVDEQVTLKPGRYLLYCSVANHRALGMSAVLVVRQP
jgi:plastocyanin